MRRLTIRLVILGVVMASSTAAHAQRPRQFGGATFVEPAGFTVTDGRTVLTYTRIRGRELCWLAVYQAEVSPPSLAAAFTNAWNTVFQRGYRAVEHPVPREAVSPAGYRHAVGEGNLEDNSGNPFVARMYLFPVGERTQTIVWIGNSRAALEGCRPEQDAFFGSLAFPGVAVVAGPRAADSAPDRPVATDAAPGAPQTFENITFTPPAGWRVQGGASGVTLSPSRVMPGEALQVVLLPGRRFSGTLAAQFAAAYDEVIQMFGATSMRTVNGTLYDLDEPARSLRGWEYLHGEGGMITSDNKRWMVRLYLIHAGDRLERVLIVASEFRAQLMTLVADRNPVHARAIRQLVFTLAFANQPSLAVAPAALTKPTSGVWGGSAMSFGGYKATFAILFDDGTAFFGPILPLEGLDGLDPSVDQPHRTRYWGSYTMSGDQGEIRVPPGPVSFRRSGSALEVDPLGTVHRFARIDPPDATGVQGTWCLADAKCIELAPSGRFRDQGLARVVEHPTYDYPETPEGGEGTYQVRNYTLILRYDSGQEWRVLCLGVVSGELWLSFNLDAAARQ